MFVEQAIHELQEQLLRVTACRKALHQELASLRSLVDTRSRVRLVEPKTLMPDWFGKNGPSWENLVIFEAGDEGRREPEAADRCDTPSA